MNINKQAMNGRKGERKRSATMASKALKLSKIIQFS